MKDTEKIVASAISNFIALHYNEELKHTPYYSKGIKLHVNKLIKELQRTEKTFDIIDEQENDIGHHLTSNLMEGIECIIKNGFIDMVMFMNIIKAYHINPKGIEGITNKIINERPSNNNSNSSKVF